ncbi:hypothetical protein BDV12DRAFT_118617 [Aspergillus spectabilis]
MLLTASIRHKVATSTMLLLSPSSRNRARVRVLKWSKEKGTRNLTSPDRGPPTEFSPPLPLDLADFLLIFLCNHNVGFNFVLIFIFRLIYLLYSVL